MILDSRVIALNEASMACQELAAHYAEDMSGDGDGDGCGLADGVLQQRHDQLNESQRLLDTEVGKLGELPKAADPDKESLEQLFDDGKAVLAEITGGALGRPYRESLADREQQLQQLLREVLAQEFDAPLSCAVSDVLEAAVVESERAAKRLSVG